jgi:threonine/homoserine/homoserine lactone efflux protein
LERILTAFLLVAVLVIVAPGPDFALTVRNTVVRGRAAGIATGLGVVSSQLLWGIATAAGIAALLVASHPAFVALRIGGAAYLIWLGVESLWAFWRGTGARERRAHGRSPFVQGLASNLGNPKMAVFFTSLLPQFGSSFGALAGHALVFSSLTLAWLVLVARAGAALRVAPVRRALDLVTGLVLVAFGARLAAGRR